ncbi:MAG: DUF4148 domain-containing protein [Ramlibacter sp.]|nr:DUF4148 domain-containing protein [Ramlibacter sp.]MBX3659820.1 DUF4148 domain-containing protein [Ramlibacter sp.]MCW5651117.1 DUF4148 domain-containing protein [Ramlibacter sp.]
MNRNIATLAIALAAVTAGNAFADDITIDTTPFTSTKTRAEVQAELSQFKKAGVNPWSTQYNQLAGFQSTKTAAQVRAEYVADRAEVAALNGEDSGAAYLANVASSAPVAAGVNLAGTPANNAQ